MRKPGAIKLVVFVFIAALLAAGWTFWLEPAHFYFEWSKVVRANIESLAHRRPPDVPRGQWEYAVGWTMNLHANCGGWDPYGADREWCIRFEAELKRRLHGPITFNDIEWIWDEYAAHTKYGQRYSDNYRPTRDPNFQLVQPGCFGLRVE